ncbi:MAG: RHS repeat-associated core domain-containing protein, partial [Bacteroidota bacterium]|nr:RHS repeat-associated core domain-containing protein [Bacteroidota bacterium]
KRYELSNHLGNVLTVITDKCILSCIGDTVSAKTADIVSATDYSPFGAPLAGRVFSSSVFRYGFNGKENDNEVKGDGGQQDYGFRIYDPRKARFLSVDPLTTSYPWYTPYQFAGNMPIWAIDLDGLEEAFATDYCDEKTGIYKRIYVLNPSAKTKDLGVIQFKYCDGNSKNV